jgi:hypothetical protein
MSDPVLPRIRICDIYQIGIVVKDVNLETLTQRFIRDE